MAVRAELRGRGEEAIVLVEAGLGPGRKRPRELRFQLVDPAERREHPYQRDVRPHIVGKLSQAAAGHRELVAIAAELVQRPRGRLPVDRRQQQQPAVRVYVRERLERLVRIVDG